MTKKKSPLKPSQDRDRSAELHAHQCKAAKAQLAKQIKNAAGIVLIIIASLALCYFHPFPGCVGDIAMLTMFGEGVFKSGRAGGVVIMKNGRQRQFKNPALVLNSYTTTVRARFSLNSSGWNSLSDAERLTWTSATGFFTTDRLGRVIPLVGKTLYTALNNALINVGATPIASAPSPAAVLGITSLGASYSLAGTLSVTFAPSPIDTDMAGVVYATRGLSPGTSKPQKSAFRQISVLNPGATTPQPLTAEYEAKFGAPSIGQKVFIKIVTTNKNTGQQDSGIITGCTVTA